MPRPVYTFSLVKTQTSSESVPAKVDPADVVCSRVRVGPMVLPKAVAKRMRQPKGMKTAARLLCENGRKSAELCSHAKRQPNVRYFWGDEYFIKVGLNDEKNTVVREAELAAWAAEVGLAPPTLPKSKTEFGVFASRRIFAPHPTLQIARTDNFRRTLVDAVRSIHTAPNRFIADPSQDTLMLGGYKHLSCRKFATNLNTHCNLIELERRFDWVTTQIKSSNETQVFSHFDIIRRNLFFIDGKVCFIDWELSRFAQPMRDLAKFFGFYDLPANDVHAILCQYHLGPPTQARAYSFALWLQAMSIDYFAWRLLDAKPNPEAILKKARHIRDLERLLPSLPKIQWRLGPPDERQIIRPDSPA